MALASLYFVLQTCSAPVFRSSIRILELGLFGSAILTYTCTNNISRSSIKIQFKKCLFWSNGHQMSECHEIRHEILDTYPCRHVIKWWCNIKSFLPTSSSTVPYPTKTTFSIRTWIIHFKCLKNYLFAFIKVGARSRRKCLILLSWICICAFAE